LTKKTGLIVKMTALKPNNFNIYKVKLTPPHQNSLAALSTPHFFRSSGAEIFEDFAFKIPQQ
jgi:hypothetical protein